MAEDAAKRLSGVSRMVPVPGGRLHVTDYRRPGPALVLMHGFPDDSRIYDRLVPLLASRRILAVDWLGHGRSDRADASAPAGWTTSMSWARCSTRFSLTG